MNENRGMAVDSSMDSVKEDEMFSFLGCMEDEGKDDVAEKRREERKGRRRVGEVRGRGGGPKVMTEKSGKRYEALAARHKKLEEAHATLKCYVKKELPGGEEPRMFQEEVSKTLRKDRVSQAPPAQLPDTRPPAPETGPLVLLGRWFLALAPVQLPLTWC